MSEAVISFTLVASREKMGEAAERKAGWKRISGVKYKKGVANVFDRSSKKDQGFGTLNLFKF